MKTTKKKCTKGGAKQKKIENLKKNESFKE